MEGVKCLYPSRQKNEMHSSQLLHEQLSSEESKDRYPLGSTSQGINASSESIKQEDFELEDQFENSDMSFGEDQDSSEGSMIDNASQKEILDEDEYPQSSEKDQDQFSMRAKIQLIDLPTNNRRGQRQVDLPYPSISKTVGYLQSIDHYTTMMQEGDYSVLYQENRLLDLLKFTSKFYDILPPVCRSKITSLFNVIKSRIEYFPYSDRIYKELLSLTQINERIYEYVGSKRNAQIRDRESDRVYQHFVQEYETKPRRQAMYYMESSKEPNRRLSLAEYMAGVEECFANGKWKDIQFAAQQIIEEFNAQHESQNNKEVQKIMKKISWGQNIHQDNHNRDISCLGCSPYFVLGANISDYHANKTKFAIISNVNNFLEEDKKKNVQQQLKKEVSGLANCQGGVILFDCERSYLNIVPRGEFLINSEFQEIKKQIEKTVSDGVFPKPTIRVDAVPIVKDPLTVTVGNQDDLNLVVIRVNVRPAHRGVRYCYYNDEDKSFEAFYRYKSIHSISNIHVKTEIVPEEQVVKKVPEKQKKSWLDKILSQPRSCYRHVCQPCKDANLKDKRPEQKAINDDLEKRFEFASAMVAKKEYLEEIRTKLKKYNFDFQLVHPFAHHNLRGTSATAILYHNDPFPEILSTISYNKQFQFEGRFTVVVAITDMIRLSERSRRKMLPPSDLDALQSWATNEYKKLQLSVKMYQYTNDKGENEIYLKVVDSQGVRHKACTLLLYLVLNHHNEKAVLRNPKELDKACQVKQSRKF